jgi:hypothetical protein
MENSSYEKISRPLGWPGLVSLVRQNQLETPSSD